MPEETKQTLTEMRADAAVAKQAVTSLDEQIKELQKERAVKQRAFRALIGKIETRVAAGEV